MGWTFRRSTKLLPGVRLNFSRSGTGVSFGAPGARISVSPNGRVTRTLGLPGTGLYHRKTIRRAGSGKRQSAQRQQPARSPAVTNLQAALDALAAGDLSTAETRARAALVQTEPHDHTEIEVQLVPGITASLPAGHDAAALLLGEILQASGDRAGALDAMKEASPTSHALVAACELLLADDRFSDVVDLTDTVTPFDEAASMALVFRGIALRELGHLQESLVTLDDIVQHVTSVEVLGVAHFERGLTRRAAGDHAGARDDFLRVDDDHWLGPAARAQAGGTPSLRGSGARVASPTPSPAPRPRISMPPSNQPRNGQAQ